MQREAKVEASRASVVLPDLSSRLEAGSRAILGARLGYQAVLHRREILELPLHFDQLKGRRATAVSWKRGQWTESMGRRR